MPASPSISTLLHLAATGGFVVAGFALWRAARLPLAARAALVALATYCVAAFVYGAVVGSALHGAFLGGVIVLPVAIVFTAIGIRWSRFRTASIRSAWNQLVVMVVSLAIVLSGLPGEIASAPTRPALQIERTAKDVGAGDSEPLADTRAQPASSPSAGERLAALDDSFRAIENGLRESRRERWDPDYVVQQVGTDPQRLFDWVRDNTSWIPYRGLLRGPAGVLNDRFGNSLDRAVLLATLLQKAGHDVRLAHRELGKKEGVELASWVTGVSPRTMEPTQAGNETPIADSPTDSRRLERVLEAEASTVEKQISGLDTAVKDQTRRLLATIDTLAAEDWGQRLDAVVAAVRDHWWVQQQEDGKWIDRDLLAPQTVAAADSVATLADIEPLHHELVVRVIAEQWSNGKTIERQAMEHAWRPAETAGQPIVLQFWPSDWLTDDLVAASDPQQAFRTMALDQQQWDVAFRIGDSVVADASIAASGDRVTPTKGGPMGSISGAFSRASGPARDEARVALTAVWIEYEIRAPGAEPRRIRRAVFDLLGPTARSQRSARFTLTDEMRETRSLSLMMRTEILPINCRLAPEYVEDLAARSLIADRKLLEAVARGEVDPGSEQTEKLMDEAAPGFTPLYALALARMEWSRLADHIFIDRLNILTRHRFLAAPGGALVVREATDIVANEVGVDLAALDAFEIRVEQGVFDTHAERLLQAGGRPIGSTAAAFAASKDWISLAARHDIQKLDLSTDARFSIASEIDAGKTIVAPRKPIRSGTEQFVGWWRIDSATGDTVGVAANGWGQDMAERGVQYSVFREMAKRFIFDYLLCRAIPVVADAIDLPIVKELFPMEAPKEAARGCLIGALASGTVFATLPLLLATLRYAGGALRPLGRFLRPRGMGPQIKYPQELGLGFKEPALEAMKKFIGKRFTEVEHLRLQAHWENAVRPGDLEAVRNGVTKAKLDGIFARSRGRFWENVFNDPAARKAIEDAGFVFEKPGNAPKLTLPDGTRTNLDVDHIARKIDEPARALDPDNLRVIFAKENRGYLESVRRLDNLQNRPFKPVGGPL